MSIATARVTSTSFERASAVAKRDARVELSYHFGQAVRLLGVVFPVATYFYVSKLVGDAPELSGYRGGYFDFVLLGLLVTSLSALGTRIFSRLIAREQGEGTLDALMSTPTALPVLLAGATVVPFAFTALDVVVYLGLGVGLFGAGFSISGLVLALPIALLTVASFVGLGILSAAVLVVTKRGEPITPLVTAATTLLAGAVFPVSMLPAPLQVVAHALPSYHAVEALRAALLGGATLVDVWDELAVLAGITALLLPFSVWVLTRALRWGRISGTLGSF